MAEFIYIDTQLKQYDHRVWVQVSQEFDLKKIGSSIISQLGGRQNTDTLKRIYQCLDNLLPGKKILIVLDDIFEDDMSELEKLKSMLHVYKKGSMVDVIVTTRSECIANKICTNDKYKLEPLKDDVCWDIIKRCSGFEDKGNKEELEKRGLNIAKKCGGAGLAAHTLGYLLQSRDLHGWSEIKNNDIWNESSRAMKVLPSLKLSYERMQPSLRLCLSYCAIFQKGHDIIEDDLIYQWMALDFIKKPSEGKEHIKRLLGMSFIRYSKLPATSRKHVVWYNMHNLVHDLARSVIGDDELTVIHAANKRKTNKQNYCRYALLANYDGQTKLSNILPNKVRALHFSSSSKSCLRGGSFSYPMCLSILDFSECSSILIPASIGHLKQLKCLIAPKIQNVRLPESIANLSKLQYLNLRGSYLISSLPESIGKLGSLVYLGLSGCSSISKLPESFGDLKGMVHLDMSRCSMISELTDSLGNLTNMQHLDLSRCYNVKEIPESLCSLTKLQYLNLSSCVHLEQIPDAVGSLIDLQYLNMSCCDNIGELPDSFANLKNLLHLDLKCSTKNGLSQALCGLTALQYLDISRIWSIWELLEDGSSSLDDAMRNLTNLKCLMFSGNMKTLFGSLIQINLRWADFIGTLTNLEHLDLSCNDYPEYLPECIGSLKKLHTLDLSYCSNLKTLPDSINTIAPKSLLIEGCRNELIDQANSGLHYSLTLPLFKVRADDKSSCSNLTLLKDVNIPELRIRSLENVRFPEEADKVKLMNKSNLSKLILAWTVHADRFLDDKDLLEQLEPPRGLKQLILEGYSSPEFPNWLMGICHHLLNLVCITLDGLPTCSNLPPLGQLPNLEELSLQNCHSVERIDKKFCGGKGAFRRLAILKMNRMERLNEWSTTYSSEDDVEEFMFPLLDKLSVMNCPRLRLGPCPPIFRECEIVKSDLVISSLEEVGGISHLTSSAASTMVIESSCKNLSLFHHFPALRELDLCHCYNLKSLPESLRHLTSLESLKVRLCKGITELPQWLGDLTSLRSLDIRECRAIKSLPPCIEQLTNLQKLDIGANLALREWCESKEHKQKLAHINRILQRPFVTEPPHLRGGSISRIFLG